MIAVYSDRIEALSHGSLAPMQTTQVFYEGRLIPVNEKLSELFLQLHISEKTGRGVPTIVSKYSKESISINDNSILVKIPFNRINDVGDKAGDKISLLWMNKLFRKLARHQKRYYFFFGITKIRYI